VLDCHTHILPAVDDGVRTLADALQLLERMQELGITEVVATPHWCSPRFNVVDALIAGAWDALRAAVAERGLTLRLHLGAEHHLSGLQPPQAFVETLRPLGGTRVVLIELPDDHLPTSTWSTLFAISRAGMRPLLAHPERCKGLSASSPLLRSYVDGGGLLQLTCGHVIGAHGLIMRWKSRRLLRRFPKACLLAGDVHDHSGPRRPRWDELPERWRPLVPDSLAALAGWG
jgi:protein-tyrosine phosphatase